MTPQEIATMTAIVAVIKEIGAWPLLSVLVLVVMGPWGGMFLFARTIDLRHSAAIKMYEENVKLVEATQRIADGMQEIVILNTQVMTQVKGSIDSNLFCPLMRKDPKVEKVLYR